MAKQERKKKEVSGEASKNEKENEEKEGERPDKMVISDNPIPQTRLLEMRRLMYLVHDELERAKVEFAKKEEILQKREDALHDKDIAMQESLISFSKFLQESAIKRKRAEKKSLDEVRLRQEKEQEILVVEDGLQKLNERRTTVLVQLDRMMMYDKYLKEVLERTPQFHEVHDLMQRHATLEASNIELRDHIAKCEAEIEEIREELLHYLKDSANTTLVLNNDVSVERQTYEKKRILTNELQTDIDSMLEKIAAKTLARSQVCIVAENLFYRIDKASIIARPVQDNPIKNLDMVGDFITDLFFIHKAYRLDLAKKQAQTPMSKA